MDSTITTEVKLRDFGKRLTAKQPLISLRSETICRMPRQYARYTIRSHWFIVFNIVSPREAGESATLMPALCKDSILSPAPPFPSAIIAPA